MKTSKDLQQARFLAAKALRDLEAELMKKCDLFASQQGGYRAFTYEMSRRVRLECPLQQRRVLRKLLKRVRNTRPQRNVWGGVVFAYEHEDHRFMYAGF